MEPKFNDLDAVAWLLAAKHDESIRETSEYGQARDRIDADPDLKQLYEQEQQFYDAHDGLLAGVRLSAEQKSRMLKTLQGEQSESRSAQPIAFPASRWLALAALLAALLAGGYAVITGGNGGDPLPPISAAQPATLDTVRSFAAQKVVRGFSLDHRSTELASIHTFLANKNCPEGNCPKSNEAFTPMGCKVFDMGGQKVSMICFETDKAGVVHVFAMKRSIVNDQDLKPANAVRVVSKRSTYAWHDANTTYVMVAHDSDVDLTAIDGIPAGA